MLLVGNSDRRAGGMGRGPRANLGWVGGSLRYLGRGSPSWPCAFVHVAISAIFSLFLGRRNVFSLTARVVVIAGKWSAGVVAKDTDEFPLRPVVARNYCYHPGVVNLQSSIFFLALAVQSEVRDNVYVTYFRFRPSGRPTFGRTAQETLAADASSCVAKTLLTFAFAAHPQLF